VRLLLDLDHWQEIRVALLRNRLRTFLTAFGVFWGIFLLMVMLGTGTGLRHGLTQEFEGSATNSLFVWSQRTQKPYAGLPAGRRPQLTNADVRAIRDKLGAAELVAPRNQLGDFGGGNNVTRGRRAGAFQVMGDHPEVLRVQSLRTQEGRFLNALDVAEARKVAVIGTRVQELLFARGESPMGGLVKINGVSFQVVGVFRSLERGEGALQDAQRIFVPFTTFQRAFNYGDRVGWLALIARDGVSAKDLQKEVLALLKSRHRVAPDDQRAFGSFNLEEEYEKVQNLFRGIAVLIWVVGIGTLAAGVIGVSNIMLIIVKERTKEIGIRRAVGAPPSAVVYQVLSEALILTLSAGYLGLVAGIAVMSLVASLLPTGDGVRMFIDPEVDVREALTALAVLVAAGVMAGLAPAQRALAVSPTVALRTD
jgi:putative ABC transport system permease protein